MPTLLLILILILLLAAIAILFRFNAKIEREWLMELHYLTRHQNPLPNDAAANAETETSAHPVRGNVVPQRERRQTKLHYQNLHRELSEQLAQQKAQQTQRRQKNRLPPAEQEELPIFTTHNTDEQPLPTAVETETSTTPAISDPRTVTAGTGSHGDLHTISLEEAMHQKWLHPSQHHTPVQQLETLVPHLPPLNRHSRAKPIEKITEKDPSLRRVLNTLSGRNSNARSMRHADHNHAIISVEDIRTHLLRRKLAGTATAPDGDFIPANNLDTIAEEEVIQNLQTSDSPIGRKSKPFIHNNGRDSIIPPEARLLYSSETPKQPLSSRFTPFQTRQHATADHTPDQTAQPEPFNIAAPSPTRSQTINTNDSQSPIRTDKQPQPLFSGSLIHNNSSSSDHTHSGAVETVLNDDREWQHTLLNHGQAPSEPPPPPSHIATVLTAPSAPPPQYPPTDTHYLLPLEDLLQPPQYNSQAAISDEELVENGIIIEEKLSEFRVKVRVVEAVAGPVITRYEIEPDVGVRGNSVINLEKDLARSLGVASIRVVETIPGKTCMGLELPNPQRQTIRLSEVLRSDAFRHSPSKLTLALGQDITGQPVVTDLAKAPHLLVAGTTGSGKSVGVNAMILSMLFKASPTDVRLIMIDPKMLELSIYEGIPHLLAPVVTDMKLAANALTWCVNEMEKRYRLMSHIGVRNLAGYNQKIQEAAKLGQGIANPFSYTPEDPEPLEKLPHIVVIVDEFADLMMVAGKKIEELIARLAQKARAAGIHLILATQRPSVDVITGLIKANIPTRIAFQVSSKVDSRTILDQMGAENLLGNGDMLFLPPGTAYPQRIHGAFVEDREVHRIVEYLKRFGEPDYVDDILTSGTGGDDMFSNANNPYPAGTNEADSLFDAAVAFVLDSGKTTISSIQRNFRIGYNRAANLVEAMENEGILSPGDANGKRTILARREHHD